GPAGPTACAGATTTAPVTVICPTVHCAPCGPVTVMDTGETGSLNVSTISFGAAARDAPLAGVLLTSSAWANAGVATASMARPASASAAVIRLRTMVVHPASRRPPERIRYDDYAPR